MNCLCKPVQADHKGSALRIWPPRCFGVSSRRNPLSMTPDSFPYRRLTPVSVRGLTETSAPVRQAQSPPWSPQCHSQVINVCSFPVNKKALLPKCLHANTFGSKAVFLTYSLTKPPRTLARHPCVLPCTAKTLHFAPPDHSGFALIENCVYLIFNQGICQLNFYEEMHD